MDFGEQTGKLVRGDLWWCLEVFLQGNKSLWPPNNLLHMAMWLCALKVTLASAQVKFFKLNLCTPRWPALVWTHPLLDYISSLLTRAITFHLARARSTFELAMTPYIYSSFSLYFGSYLYIYCFCQNWSVSVNLVWSQGWDWTTHEHNTVPASDKHPHNMMLPPQYIKNTKGCHCCIGFLPCLRLWYLWLTD